MHGNELYGVAGLFCCLGGIALVVFLSVFSIRRERKRQDRLRQWATGHEWTYTPRPSTNWPARLPGHNKRGVTLALSGQVQGRPVSVGEYYYTETQSTSNADGTSGSSSTTHHFVVVAIWFNEQYPPIGVRPRGMFSKMGRALFGDEREVGHDQFDREFRVTTKDAAYARRMVGPGLVQAHLAKAVPAWDLRGNELMAYYTGRIGEPERIPAFIDPVLRVAALLGR
jgi:hypothetical protein